MHGLKPRPKASQNPSLGLGFKPFRNGGPIGGPGTGISDSIQTTMPEGSYVMPADSSQVLGHENLMQMGDSQGGVPVAVSNGEHEMPPEQVHAVGVQALDQMKAATHQPVGGLAMQQPQEPQRYFANGGHVGGYGLLRRATGGVVSEDERQRQNAQVVGAPGVQRTGNSYSDAAAVPAAPRLGVPSWEGRQSFPATHQRERTAIPQQAPNGLANQIPGPSQSQLNAAENIGSGRANASAPEPVRPQVPTQSSPGTAYGQGPMNSALFGAGSPTGMYVADQQAVRQKMVDSGNYAGAAGNTLKTGAVAAGMGILELADKTVGNAVRGLSDPGGTVGRFAGGALGTDNPDGSIAGATAPKAAATPRGLAFNNDQIANNMLGINGITSSSLSGANAPGPARQNDMMARTEGTGRGFSLGAQHATADSQPAATVAYMSDGRRGKTNAQVGAENPDGRVQMVRRENGTMSFSGNHVRGPVFYTDGQGQPLAGGGLRGKGFASVDTVSSNAMGAAQGSQPNSQTLAAARDAAAQRGDWDGVAQSYAAQGAPFNGQAPEHIQAGLNRPATVVDAPPLGFSSRAARSAQLRQQRMQDAMRDGSITRSHRSALADIYRSDNSLEEASMRGANDMARAHMEQHGATQRQGSANATSLTETAMREAGQSQRTQADVALGLRNMAIRETEATDTARMRGMELENAQRLQVLRSQYAATQDDALRASLARQILELSGNARPQNENLSNSFMSVGGGQEWNDKAGVMRNVPQRLIDLRTGQEVGGSQQGIQPPEHHISLLRKDPSKEAKLEFDGMYGSGAAARILGS